MNADDISGVERITAVSCDICVLVLSDLSLFGGLGAGVAATCT